VIHALDQLVVDGPAVRLQIPLVRHEGLVQVGEHVGRLGLDVEHLAGLRMDDGEAGPVGCIAHVRLI
jgi:hypothetical protein